MGRGSEQSAIICRTANNCYCYISCGVSSGLRVVTAFSFVITLAPQLMESAVQIQSVWTVHAVLGMMKNTYLAEKVVIDREVQPKFLDVSLVPLDLPGRTVVSKA